LAVATLGFLSSIWLGNVLRLFSSTGVFTIKRFWSQRWAMAKIIPFYIPKDFRSNPKPVKTRGEIIEFHLPKKSA
jgi:hypothetical protein